MFACRRCKLVSGSANLFCLRQFQATASIRAPAHLGFCAKHNRFWFTAHAPVHVQLVWTWLSGARLLVCLMDYMIVCVHVLASLSLPFKPSIRIAHIALQSFLPEVCWTEIIIFQYWPWVAIGLEVLVAHHPKALSGPRVSEIS